MNWLTDRFAEGSTIRGILIASAMLVSTRYPEYTQVTDAVIGVLAGYSILRKEV